MEQLWLWEELLKFHKIPLKIPLSIISKFKTYTHHYQFQILWTNFKNWNSFWDLKWKVILLSSKLLLDNIFLGHKPIFVSIYRIIDASPQTRDIFPYLSEMQYPRRLYWVGTTFSTSFPNGTHLFENTTTYAMHFVSSAVVWWQPESSATGKVNW